MFVEIKAVGFPVLVQAKIQIELRLALKPGNVGADFRSLRIAIIAVQIPAVGILAPVEDKTRRIQARTKPQFDILRPILYWFSENRNFAFERLAGVQGQRRSLITL